jgi:hypothetical protein
MEHLRGSHPICTVTNAMLRAEEQDRYVFAVFYRQAGPPVVPPRYALVAVGRECSTVEALDTSPTSPYWIRGRK